MHAHIMHAHTLRLKRERLSIEQTTPQGKTFKRLAAPFTLLLLPLAHLTRPGQREALAAPAGGEGLEVCADCHPQEARAFSETGMGRALSPARDARVIERFEQGRASVRHPLTGVTYEAWIDAEGRWWQSEVLGDYRRDVEARFVIGSGNHARSYLGEVEGEVVELPLTWYTRRGIWDMSPGYEGADHMRFERPVKPDCLFCHNDLTAADPNTLAGYLEPLKEGITCGRCHGPGEEHARAHLTGEGDPAIFNPARLPPARADEVCLQCHLAGEARVLMPTRRWDQYDPREPLAEHHVVYGVARDSLGDEGAEEGAEGFGIASHGERLALSPCARGPRPLTCATCHSPHPTPTSRAGRAGDSWARAGACLECHAPSPRLAAAHARDALPGEVWAEEAAGGDCARCHMRQGGTSDIPHVRFTDHKIRARLSAPTLSAPAASRSAAPAPTPSSSSAVVPPTLAPAAPSTAPTPLRPLSPLSPRLDERARGLLLGLAYEQVVRFSERRGYEPLAARQLSEAISQETPQPPSLSGAPPTAPSPLLGTPHQPLSQAELSSLLARAHLSLSLVMESTEDFKKAHANTRLSVQYEAPSHLTLFSEALTLARLGRLAESAAVLEELIALKPTHRRALGELANLRLTLGQLSEAALLYERADALAPHEMGTALNRAALEERRGDLAGARRWALEARRRDGVSPLPPLRLALLSLAARAPGEAGRWAEEALARALTPQARGEALGLALEAALARGALAEALTHARALRPLAADLNLSPELPAALDALTRDLERRLAPPALRAPAP